MPGEIQTTASVIIRRPLVEVFHKVCDVRSVPDWVPFCNQAEVIRASTAPDAHNGVGTGMTATFGFGFGRANVRVLQRITSFEWGRTLSFSTTSARDAAPESEDLLGAAMAAFVPRTSVRFDFEPTAAGTVLTVEVSIWATTIGALDLGRPMAADGLLQALTRLKHTIERSEASVFPPWIFFNYRRADTEFASDRVYDALRQEFGEGAIFRDVFHVPAGADIEEAIRNRIAETFVFIAVIGPNWLPELTRRARAPALRGRGRPRGAGQGPDYVVRELAMALNMGKQKMTVIPLLVGEVGFPEPVELPESLQDLATRNAVRVRRDPDFADDANRLKKQLWGELLRRRGPAIRER